jgi:hypothetical protein
VTAADPTVCCSSRRSRGVRRITPRETFRIPMTPEEDKKVRDFIEERRQNAGKYRIPARTCGEFVRDALKAGAWILAAAGSLLQG